MPGMSGRELVATIRPLRKEIRIIYMSGYTTDAVVSHGVLDEGVAFIQKPLSLKTLSERVRAVLDAERPPRV